jgi:hypothetical protein
MGVMIQGVRLGDLHLEKTSEGILKPVGNFELVTEQGTVLAKQTFNGYNDLAIAFCPDTVEALHNFKSLVQRDIQKMLGF